jgi:hypothetical protein
MIGLLEKGVFNFEKTPKDNFVCVFFNIIIFIVDCYMSIGKMMSY